MKPTVSIIIPTYNRAHLIGETLDSIMAQTYPDWECIIVDDGSTDHTDEVVGSYVEKDARFQYFHRPNHRPKGANACRNYGFEKSKGAFIQWFDSDDMFMPVALETKLRVLRDEDLDYVITKSLDFLHPDPTHILGFDRAYYGYGELPATHLNYVQQKVNWLTIDPLFSRSVFRNILFNERLPSSQEYNLFSQITSQPFRLKTLEDVTVLRRVHKGSLQQHLRANKNKYLGHRMIVYIETWKDLRNLDIPIEQPSMRYLLEKGINDSLNLKVPVAGSGLFHLCREIWHQYSLSLALRYGIYQIIGRALKRGHFFRKLFTRKWNEHQKFQ